MPARSEWRGFLQINQLRVPVRAYSAVAADPEVELSQTHRQCGERLRGQKVCPVHGLVEPEDVSIGVTGAGGAHLALTPEEVDQLRPAPGHAISVECFVEPEVIDPLYYTGRTLYLVPDGPQGQRPFGVLREGMQASGRWAFSRVVMARKEYLVLLRPLERLLAMMVLEYPQRILKASDLDGEITAIHPGDYELALIRELIETQTDTRFDLSQYRDRYVDRLNALIERRGTESDQPAVSPGLRLVQPKESGANSEAISTMQASLMAAGLCDHTAPPVPPALQDLRSDTGSESLFG